MGKALVVSGGPGGLYTVKLLLHRARVEKRLTQLAEEIAAIDPVKLAQAQAALDEAQAALDHAITIQDLAISSEDREGMTAAAVTVAQRAGDRDKARLALNALTLRLAALRKEQAYLTTAMPADPAVSVWCADYSEDLAGEIATLEIPGERKNGAVLIRPGFAGNAAFTAARDGQLQPTIASTPAGTFFNWALLPGWQKWQPTYRLGTITALTGDTCSVILDPATSSAQQLPVNQSETLTGVPITYMDCHGAAFALNDRVVVAFDDQDWTQPRVVGFESNPRPCRLAEFWCNPVSNTESIAGLALRRDGSQWRTRTPVDGVLQAGNRRQNWQSGDGRTVLTHSTGALFQGGVAVAARPAYLSSFYGFGIYPDSQGQRWLWAVGTRSSAAGPQLAGTLAVLKKTWPGSATVTALYSQSAYEQAVAAGDTAAAEAEAAKWRLLGEYHLGQLETSYATSPPLGRVAVNASGTEALLQLGRYTSTPSGTPPPWNGYLIITPEPFSVTAVPNAPIEIHYTWDRSSAADDTWPSPEPEAPLPPNCDLTVEGVSTGHDTGSITQSASGSLVIDVGYAGDQRLLATVNVLYSGSSSDHTETEAHTTKQYRYVEDVGCVFDRTILHSSSEQHHRSANLYVTLTLGDRTWVLEDLTQASNDDLTLSWRRFNNTYTDLNGGRESATSGNRDYLKLWYLHADRRWLLADHLSTAFTSGVSRTPVLVNNDQAIFWEVTGETPVSNPATLDNYQLHTADGTQVVSDPQQTTHGWAADGLPVNTPSGDPNTAGSGVLYGIPLFLPLTTLNTWSQVEWWANGRRLYGQEFYSVPKILATWPNQYQAQGGVDTSVWYNYLTGGNPVALSGLSGANPRFTNIGLG